MKKNVKWFMGLTKDSSTETKKWENLVFRANVLLSWIGCLVAIIAVCGLCFTSCTSDEEMKKKDHELQVRIDKLDCAEKIEVNKEEYPFLFKRLRYQNGMMQFGERNYRVRQIAGNSWYLIDHDKEYGYLQLSLEPERSMMDIRIPVMYISLNCGRFVDVVEINGFKLTLLEYTNSTYTLYVQNLDGESFAYADMVRNHTNQPIWQQLSFSAGFTDTIHVDMASRLILYEYIIDENGKKLKENCRIPYVASLFGL